MSKEVKQKEDTLIQVWNRLNSLWSHEQDGSFLYPIPKEFQNDPYNKKLTERRKRSGNESILFDIVFNEIAHKIKKSVSPERHKELN